MSLDKREMLSTFDAAMNDSAQKTENDMDDMAACRKSDKMFFQLQKHDEISSINRSPNDQVLCKWLKLAFNTYTFMNEFLRLNEASEASKIHETRFERNLEIVCYLVKIEIVYSSWLIFWPMAIPLTFYK